MHHLKHFLSFVFSVLAVDAYRIFQENGVQLLFAKHGENVRIVCHDNVPLARCGYTHPNGTNLFFLNLTPGTPQCEFNVKISNLDSGLWTCHIWPQFSPQEETKKLINIRIVNKFAAINKNVEVNLGETVILSCVTTESMVPLNHCYFTTPLGDRLNMVHDITSARALMNKYYFPANKSVHRGDCAVTIESVSNEDSGAWACNGWIEHENIEYRDTINLIFKNKIDSNEEIQNNKTILVVPTDDEQEYNLRTEHVMIYILAVLITITSITAIATIFYRKMESSTSYSYRNSTVKYLLNRLTVKDKRMFENTNLVTTALSDL